MKGCCAMLNTQTLIVAVPSCSNTINIHPDTTTCLPPDDEAVSGIQFLMLVSKNPPLC